MKTEHAYANIFRAIAEGNEIQFCISDGNEWNNQSLHCTLDEIANDAFPPECYRVKPNTILVGKIEVAKPLTIAPPYGDDYFYIDAMTEEGTSVQSSCWSGDRWDKQVLASGLCWATREDAEHAAQAIKTLLKGE